MSTDDTPLQVPAQSIPVPRSLSAQGRAYLAAAARKLSARGSSPGSVDASSELVESEAAVIPFLRTIAKQFKGSFESIALPSGAALYRVTPDGRTEQRSKLVYFDIHGGGFVVGGGELCQLTAKIRAHDFGTEVYSVDYRLLPNHPFPAGLDDCVAAYRAVLGNHSASTLILGGASAGGNLAAALILRARDEGLPLPLALLLQTPALDMTRSGDSFETNRYLDVNLHGGTGAESLRRYAANHDSAHPYMSPLFGDFAKGWPPTLLTTGTRDLLLSDTVRMHRALRRAGVRAELHVSEASPHGGFMGGAPEDAEMMAECRRFIYSAWGIEG